MRNKTTIYLDGSSAGRKHYLDVYVGENSETAKCIHTLEFAGNETDNMMQEAVKEYRNDVYGKVGEEVKIEWCDDDGTITLL